MQIKEFREYFSVMGKCHFSIDPCSACRGWHLSAYLPKYPNDKAIYLSTQRGEKKTYKSLDSAYKDLKRIQGYDPAHTISFKTVIADSDALEWNI